MNGYRNITLWESLRRQERLNEIHELIVTYYTALQKGQAGQASEARISINLILKDVQAIVYAAEVYPVISWTPPRFVGGPSIEIDILENLFYLKRYDLGSETVIDLLVRAFGVYESYHLQSFLRTINPFWWLWRIFNWFAKLPFLLLGSAGFNSTRAENSILGRFFKLALLLLPLVAASLSILSHLDLLEEFLELVKGMMEVLYPSSLSSPPDAEGTMLGPRAQQQSYLCIS